MGQAEQNQADRVEQRLEDVLGIINSIESDLAMDRSKIDRILIELEALKGRVKSMEDRFPRVENKFQDALQRTLEPLTRAMDRLPKKKTDRQSFLKRLLRGVRNNG